MKSTKTVQVLTIYRFKETARICFVVESSNGKDTYNTCFNRDAEHGSCTCPALRGCYHLDQLKARAAEYFAARQPSQPESTSVAILVPEGVAIIDKSELKSTDILAEPVKKVDPMTEAQQFIAKVQAEKAALHNSNESTFESAPSGRLVPMR